MTWIIFALGAALAWGLYGPVLHQGQVQLGNPFRALLCVGIAYFLIGVLVPLIALSSQGGLSGFNARDHSMRRSEERWARSELSSSFSPSNPAACLPYVAACFGGAPLINVLVSSLLHPPKTAPNPLLYLGYLLSALGAGLVLYFKP